MSATLFDLFCLEVVPAHMAEVERLRLQWQQAYFRFLDEPDNGSLNGDLRLYRLGYEKALKEAKVAFASNFKPGDRP